MTKVVLASDVQSGIGGNTTDREYRLTGLKHDQAYAVAVRPDIEGTEGTTSNVPSVSTNALPTTVPPPTELELVEGNGSITASWKAPETPEGAPIDNYKVTTEGGDRTFVDMPTGTAITVSGLMNGTEYKVTVMAMWGTNESTGIEKSATPMAPAPMPMPVTITSVTPGDGSLTVMWTAPATGATPTGYEVSAMAAGGATVTVPMLPASATSAMISPLVNGTMYTVSVVTVAGTDKSTAATMQGTPAAPTVVPTKPGMVTELMLTAGDGMISASWKMPTSGAAATGYKATAMAAGGDPMMCTVTGMTAECAELMNDTEYTVSVVAMAGDVEGDPVTDKATPKGMDPTPTPALPIAGLFVLGAGLVAAGRRRLTLLAAPDRRRLTR